MKKNQSKLVQRIVVGVLSVIGLLALCGEPAEGSNFLAVVFGQIAVCAACWAAAWLLARKWDICNK